MPRVSATASRPKPESLLSAAVLLAVTAVTAVAQELPPKVLRTITPEGMDRDRDGTIQCDEFAAAIVHRNRSRGPQDVALTVEPLGTCPVAVVRRDRRRQVQVVAGRLSETTRLVTRVEDGEDVEVTCAATDAPQEKAQCRFRAGAKTVYSTDGTLREGRAVDRGFKIQPKSLETCEEDLPELLYLNDTRRSLIVTGLATAAACDLEITLPQVTTVTIDAGTSQGFTLELAPGQGLTVGCTRFPLDPGGARFCEYTVRGLGP